MDVLDLAVELDELAAPILAALVDDVLQHVEHRPRDAGASVLGHENQVVAQRIHTMEKRAHLDVLGHLN